jgi:hypothetical protein
MALRFLADPACEASRHSLSRRAGALARRTASLLAERNVPHNDGLAHPAPGAFEDPVWPMWIELQENPRLPALLRVSSARTRHQNRFFSG